MARNASRTREVPERRRQPALRWLRRLAWVAVPLALAGELGHQLLGRLGHLVAHHWFHILFAGGAASVFIAYVIVDVRRHGWPTFSWRLRSAERPGGTAASARR